MAKITPHTTFQPFGRLPKELRLLIWYLAITEPRTVSVQFRYNCPDAADEWEKLYDYAPTNPPPAVLHACGEARTEALKFYTQELTDGLCPRYTYINYEIDTIYVQQYHFASFLCEDRAKIRKLRLDVDESERFENVVRWQMAEMPGLKELEVVTWGNDFPFAENAYNPTFNEVLAVMEPFKRQFEKLEGWVMPTLRLSHVGIAWELKAGSAGPPEVVWEESEHGFLIFDEE